MTCDNPPEVAVTVSVYEPAGVPVVPPPPPPPPPPAPQFPQRSARKRAAPHGANLSPFFRTAKETKNKIVMKASHQSHCPKRILIPGSSCRPRHRPPTPERAVVVRVTVAVKVLVPSMATELGEMEQVAAWGAPEQLSETT